MRRSAGLRALLGLLLTVGIGAAGYYGTRFAQGAFAEDYRFTVVVGEAGQGLVRGSDVAFRGVLIGKVGEISLNDELEAQVEVILEPEYQIPETAMFAVVGKTLFGEKQFEVRYDGDPAEADEYIADGGMVRNPEQVVEVQDLLQELNGLFAAINPDDLAVVINDGMGAFVGQEDAIGRAIDQGVRATDVFAGSLDDQVPGIHDLSLVAETLGTVGDDFNRLGALIDQGALDTVTANQARLEVLLDALTAFGDELNLVLTLTRDDLDRLLIQGDNVTRMLFAYRPELSELLTGIEEYARTIGEGGQSDPGFTGLAAGFQIIIEGEGGPSDFCGQLPPELAQQLPGCSAAVAAALQQFAETGQPVPDVPLVEVPAGIDAAPEPSAGDGLQRVLDNVLDGLGVANGRSGGDRG